MEPPVRVAYVHFAHLIIVKAVNVTRHPKVTDLHGELFPHETVAGGQITVDKVMLGKVLGPSGHLSADVQQLIKAENCYW